MPVKEEVCYHSSSLEKKSGAILHLCAQQMMKKGVYAYILT